MVSIALLSPPEISATTIIAFVRADHIVMATDAMSIVFNNVEVQRVKICKIYQSGSSFFAFAGIDQDDSIGFVSSDLAKRGMVLNLKGRSEQFAADVKAPLLESLQRVHKTSRQNYRKYLPLTVLLLRLYSLV